MEKKVGIKKTSNIHRVYQQQTGKSSPLKSPHPPQAESSPISMSGKSSSFIHCIPGLRLTAALEDFAKELKTGIPNHSLENLI